MNQKTLLEIQGTDPRYVSRTQLSGLSGDQLEIIGLLKDVPTLEKPYSKILEQIRGAGKLEMATWHSCETTHCVGGWTVVLTPKGKELEQKFDTATAARMILSAIRPEARAAEEV